MGGPPLLLLGARWPLASVWRAAAAPSGLRGGLFWPDSRFGGGAQPKPEPKHTHPHRTPQPGVAGYKRSAHTSTHKRNHSSQEWRGAAETRAQARTHTPHTPARNCGVQAGSAHTNTHTPTPQPGVAGRSRNPSSSTHTHTAHPSQERRGTTGERTQTHTPQHPSQEWREAAETRAQAHTPTPHSPARSGGVQVGCAHRHTHTPNPQPGVAGRSQNLARIHTCTPHTPARSGGVQAERAHKHKQAPTPQPGVAGYMRSTHANKHTPHHPSQEWWGAAETRAQAQPGPKHKDHTTVGNPVSIAWALRQPVPCR